MSIKKIFLSGVFLSVGLLQTGYALAEGSIIIWEGDNAHSCSIPAVPGTNGGPRNYVITDAGCTNDQAYTVNFINVDSALSITFFDDTKGGYCPADEGWEIEVLTVKQPTTTDPVNRMSLAAMAGVPDGSLIVPGVVKVRNRSDGNIPGKLSCVQVQRK